MTAPSSDACGRAATAPRLPDQAGAPGAAGARRRSTFRLPGMDCPAEEQMVRLQLARDGVYALAFDLPARRLTVDHADEAAAILERLLPLGYGAELVSSRSLGAADAAADAAAAAARASGDAAEAQVLWTLLAINSLMFVLELGAGWWAQSAGLIADAMDMFADAAVYGAALYAVGRGAARKLGAARLAGALQLLLALAALGETARRFLAGAAPEGLAMVGISLLALAANIACLLLLARHRGGGVHMRASYIFSANDVIANLGVIAAGALVSWSGSAWPDWVIGSAIGLVVLVGAVRILHLR